MRRLAITCFILFILGAAAEAAAQCVPPGGDGIGRIWCIDFGTGAAKRDGQIIVNWTAERQGGGQQRFNMDIDVRNGDTADAKATRLLNNLRGATHSRNVNSCRNGNTVCMQLKRTNPLGLSNVTEGTIAEVRTGEGAVRIYDPPSSLMTGVLILGGYPESEDGLVTLQIGYDNPVVSVSTYGRPLEEILLDLAAHFNQAYADAGSPYKAMAIRPQDAASPGGIEIPFIPCDQGGISGGSTDTGLTYEVGLLETGVQRALQGRATVKPIPETLPEN